MKKIERKGKIGFIATVSEFQKKGILDNHVTGIAALQFIIIYQDHTIEEVSGTVAQKLINATYK